MSDLSGIDWEDAFSNGAYIAESAHYPEKWASRAAAFRAKADARLDSPYGEHPRECLDLFYPETHPKGLAVFVHGGYWLDFDKSSWSDLAEGALARGWGVAIPSYTLAPDVTIPEITRQIGQAISKAAAMIEGPIRLAGHSAGGHLVTRMICDTPPLSREITSRIERVISISGLHDLRPLRLHSMNDRLRLDEQSAITESPALCAPLADIEVTAWVGACERPEFLRQSALLVEAWSRKEANVKLVSEPERHHFNLIDGLKSADHPLTQAFVGA